MKKIFLILVLILIMSSCKNKEQENKIKEYEKLIKELSIEDMKKNKEFLIHDMNKIQASINFEMRVFENNTDHEPIEFEYMFYSLFKLNNICLDFYTSSINSRDFNKINESLDKVKKTIVNLRRIGNQEQKLIKLKKLTKIKNEIDNYKINRELKLLVLYLLREDRRQTLSYDSDGSCRSCSSFIGSRPAYLTSKRLNDSIVAIDIEKSDQPNLLKIRELKNIKTKKNIVFNTKTRNLHSYIIKTKSDTLKFRASLMESANYHRLSKLDTTIIVNKGYYFKKVASRYYTVD